MNTTRTTHGEWIFIFPISHLKLTPSVNNELAIGNVTFITLSKLYRNRKKFGILDTIKEIRQYASIDETLNGFGETLALVKKRGEEKLARKDAEKEVNEKLLILSVSQFFYNRGIQISKPCISKNNFYSVQSIRLNLHKKSAGSSYDARGTRLPLVLDADWVRVNKFYYFFKLIKHLKKEKRLFNSWEQSLYRSLVLAGKSINEEDVAQAFLLRMIAIESVIIGDIKHQETFVNFFKALIGWSLDWETKSFEEEIKKIYVKRSRYVHNGKADEITEEDLLFTEVLILNLYNNIFRNIKHFDSKEKLKELIDTSNAIDTLGLKDKRRIFLPKGLKYSFKT
jgi:hypothetical protein